MMCFSDTVQETTVCKIESAVERYERLKREQEAAHYRILGNVIRDTGMNRFDSRGIRDAYREARDD